LKAALEVPGHLTERYRDWSWTLVWQWATIETWRVEGGDEVVFVKITASDNFPNGREEAARILWASEHLPVPKLLDHGSEGGFDWMVTRGLPGRPAVDPGLMADPQRLVPILAGGLRFFHEAPSTDCPFKLRAEVALEQVRVRAEAGVIDPEEDFHEEHRHLDVEGAVRELERLFPEDEDLVVCHGDYCLPNVLVEEGRAVGFVDLGELGVADRWWDVAVGAWSCTWNLGPGFEDLFYRTYGIEPDERKIAFYRLLYDLVS
jgi:kanamycin kinase